MAEKQIIEQSATTAELILGGGAKELQPGQDNLDSTTGRYMHRDYSNNFYEELHILNGTVTATGDLLYVDSDTYSLTRSADLNWDATNKNFFIRDSAASGAVTLYFQNNTTGVTVSNGLRVGIDSNEDGVIANLTAAKDITITSQKDIVFTQSADFEINGVDTRITPSGDVTINNGGLINITPAGNFTVNNGAAIAFTATTTFVASATTFTFTSTLPSGDFTINLEDSTGNASLIVNVGPSGTMHLINSTSSAEVYQLYQNLTTGITTGDGFRVGIDANEDGIIENLETGSHLKLITTGTGGVYVTNIKSGANQGAALAAAGELWKTASHATLPDNVILIGV